MQERLHRPTGPSHFSLDMIRLLKRSMEDPETITYSDQDQDEVQEEDEYPVNIKRGMVRLLRSGPSNYLIM